ncbi:MAG: hypothetical protein QXI12_08545 [Candidatus Methanomethyliaceae archaeon]
MRIRNPYRWDKVNIDLFYGRDPLRWELVEGLRNGQSFGITAGRRMGKTTLLRRVEADLAEHSKQWLEGGLLVIPVYVDGWSLSHPITPDGVFAIILNMIERLLKPWSALTASLPEELPPVHPFAARLAGVVNCLPGYRPQIIILFDEVEPILKHDWGQSFFANWRSLLHNEPAVSPYISAAFAGASEMFQLTRDVGSPLSNILAWRELTLFSEEDTSLLVNEPTHGLLPAKFAERVFLETGGHPSLIQYLMKFVCDREIEDADRSLEEAIEAFHTQERDKLERWWEKLPPLAQQLYAHILQHDVPVTRRFLIQSFDGADINRALSILCHSGLVSYCPEEDSFVPAGRIFPRWFHKFGVIQNTTGLVDQVDRLIKNLEKVLRRFLQQHLEQKYGDNWLNQIEKIRVRDRNGAMISLLDTWRENAKRRDLKNEEALLYSQLGDLFALIGREWGDLKTYFQFSHDPSKNKALLEERKDCLVSVRNALRHARDETVSVTDLLKAQAFCTEMLQFLGEGNHTDECYVTKDSPNICSRSAPRVRSAPGV